MSKRKQPVNREDWLQQLADMLRWDYEDNGFPIPEKVHISVGFPSKRALSRKNKRVGECWTPAESDVPHIFISPLLEGYDAAHVLVHELAHAAVGCKHGHRGPFVALCQALDLQPKGGKRGKGYTSTAPGERLTDRLNEAMSKLGPYPHTTLTPQDLARDKDKGRMLKITCACAEPRILRVTRKVIDQGGISCELCGYLFSEED